jgi:hypothetical protein
MCKHDNAVGVETLAEWRKVLSKLETLMMTLLALRGSKRVEISLENMKRTCGGKLHDAKGLESRDWHFHL